jgi:ribose 5-phosphate isomerase B
MNMLYIASDHAGYQLKKYLTRYLKVQLKRDFEDLGPEEYDKEDDFPDFAAKVARKVASKKDALGILICGSGQGVCITANKFKGIRAILGYSIEAAELARKHDFANVLCLAGRVLSNEHAIAIVKTFLENEPKQEKRFLRRIEKIRKIEEK